MPWGDATGPWGMGPMTGRAAGYCAGYPIPGAMNLMPGRTYKGDFAWGGPYLAGYYGPGRPFGLGRGGFYRGWRCFGRGRGRGHGRFARFLYR